MPRDFDENERNEGDFEREERDAYDILAEWMVDKQGDDTQNTFEDIRNALEAADVVMEDGTVDEQAMQEALDSLGLEYEGFDAETWEDIIVQYEDK